MSSWLTEWEFKGKYLNVTKLSQIGALADEDKVYRIFISPHFRLNTFTCCDINVESTSCALVLLHCLAISTFCEP